MITREKKADESNGGVALINFFVPDAALIRVNTVNETFQDGYQSFA